MAGKDGEEFLVSIGNARRADTPVKQKLTECPVHLPEATILQQIPDKSYTHFNECIIITLERDIPKHVPRRDLKAGRQDISDGNL